MNTHLNTMVCGHGLRTEKKVRRSYLGLYSSVGAEFLCNGCDKRYNSVRGVHRHLETHDACGLKSPQIEEEMKTVNVKKKPSPMRNFKDLYIKQDGRYICKTCETYYQSIKGIHHHLTNKSCGFGQGNTDKKYLRELYERVGGKYACRKCFQEFENYVGVWRHLKTCLKE